jgi:hypothetical protein
VGGGGALLGSTRKMRQGPPCLHGAGAGSHPSSVGHRAPPRSARGWPAQGGPQGHRQNKTWNPNTARRRFTCCSCSSRRWQANQERILSRRFRP